MVPQSTPYLAPGYSRSFQDPAVELASRRMLESYFGPEGLISQQIPVPIQQVAGLSPQEIQARNLAQGLGGFGSQLAEAAFYKQKSKVSEGFKLDLAMAKQGQAVQKMNEAKKQIKSCL